MTNEGSLPLSHLRHSSVIDVKIDSHISPICKNTKEQICIKIQDFNKGTTASCKKNNLDKFSLPA